MRLHFQERPWDLYFSLGYTAFLGILLVVMNVGNPFALFFVVLFPGYALVALLFPRASEVEWMVRIALSFGLSVAIVALLGLALNFTPWGIRFVPMVAAITAFTILCTLVAYKRRMGLAPGVRLSATLNVNWPSRAGDKYVDSALTIGLVASVIIAGSAISYTILVPRPGEYFSEIYLLGPGGNASGYPTHLNASQPGTVVLGIVNHEGRPMVYATRVDLVGVEIVANKTFDRNQTTISWVNATIEDGRNWTQPFTFRIDTLGLWRVQFLLYENGSLTNQRVHFFVRVT